ncbi:LysR family transcriptional regulator [Stenotrophomonas maltophilia]|nr:LysR family transcriptional regulator [Stenotrophomonas maltophilia]
MNIEDLRTFVEVADAGGVSPAALRLGVAKSIVSRRLLRLEQELGVLLLARTTRGAALTEAGAIFRDYAARVCAEIDLARDTILPAGELSGRLRITANLSFGPTHFASVIAELARRHPQLHIHTCYSDHVADLIADGYDCGIRLGYLPDSTLLARRIGTIHGTLVSSPSYAEAHGSPETIEELLTHKILMQGAETWQLMEGDQIIMVRPQGRFKADNSIALVSAATAGLGIARLPDGLIHEHLAHGALIPVMSRHPVAPAGAYVVSPPGQYPSRKVRVLTDLLIEHCEQSPYFARAVYK